MAITKQRILDLAGATLRPATREDRAQGRTDDQRRAEWIIETARGDVWYSLRGSIEDIIMAVSS